MAYRTAVDLHSIRASGQVGRQHIYWFAHGFEHRRPYKVPADPQTPRQLTKRGFFWQAHQYWNNLSENEKSFYHDKAKVLGRYPAGVQYFLSQWLRGLIVAETVRSLQRGTKVCADGANDVAIVAVAVAKAFVYTGTYHCGSSLGVADEHGVCGAELTSSTNLRIHAVKGALADAPSCCWQVIEFY